MVHIPATISSVKKEGLKEWKREKQESEDEWESVQQEWMSVLSLFGEEGLGWGKSLLSDVNGLFPGQYASQVCVCGCVCVCACIFVCVCVFHAQTVVQSNHDLHIKAEVFDDRDRDSCHNKITTITPLQFFHSSSLMSSAQFVFSLAGLSMVSDMNYN